MTKTKFDKIYSTPGKLDKVGLFLDYQLRQLGWRAKDIIEGCGNQSSLDSEEYDTEIIETYRRRSKLRMLIQKEM